MPITCCVRNCKSRGDRDNVKFFRIPSVLNLKHKNDLNDLSKRRREKWLQAIKRNDMTETNVKYSRVCSKHFVSGKSSDLNDKSNIDWIPTLLMGYGKEEEVLRKQKLALDRKIRLEKRKKKLEDTFSESYEELQQNSSIEDSTGTPDILKISNTCQKETDISKMSLIVVIKKNFQDSTGTTNIPEVNSGTSYIPKQKNIYQKKTDISNMCRVCLTQSPKTMYDLTSTIGDITDSANNEIPIIQALQTVTSTTVIIHPNYPQYICPMCLSILKMAYKFILNFKESQMQLERKRGIDGAIGNGIDVGMNVKETENNRKSENIGFLIDEDSMHIEESKTKFNRLSKKITAQKNEEPKLETLGKKLKMKSDIDNEMILGMEGKETDDNWKKGKVELIIDEEEFDSSNVNVEEDEECKEKLDGLLSELGITATPAGGTFKESNLDNDDTITILMKDENSGLSLRKLRKDEPMDQIRVEVESDEYKTVSDLEHMNSDEIELWENEPTSESGELQTDDDAEDAIVATESLHDHTYSETNIADLSYNENDKLIDSWRHSISELTPEIALFPSGRESDYAEHTDKPLSKMFSCERCGRSYNTKQKLKEHISTHLVKKRFLCNLCGARFYQQNGLFRHMLLHTYGKRYQCPYCAKLFSLASSLQHHERTHISEKYFQCKFCDEEFSSKSERSAHESIHTGFNPYVCKFCLEGFTKANDLKQHLFQHSGPHSCNICDRNFIDKPILQMHYKQSHETLLPDIDISGWKLSDYCEEAAALEEM